MLTIKYHRSFKRDYKRVKKRGYDISLLTEAARMLADGKALPAKYRDHPLSGDYSGCEKGRQINES